ncbi:pyridoxal phosphate-dependent aminotransferase [Hippea sp. KM1]|uniref:pyridoxal phosphate-dependent aminotransferase n=1 Tax=Hippea sp. KM1 TaxID=944481 RepID=UPI00046D0580|nr:pyridoxal phosphate-dependent aminotransferase [Hippea sp. KM1]
MSKAKLNARINRIEPSMTIGISAKAKELCAAGLDVLSFSAGEPDFDTPDNIKIAAIKATVDGFTKYTAAGGINELRDAVVEKQKRRNGLDYKRENVCISVGAKHALFNIAAVMLEEGDEIIIPAPYWVTYEAIAKYVGAKPVIIETKEENGFIPTPEDWEKAITPNTKMILLNNPSNPTGATYEKEDLEFIAKLAEKHDLWIISDEIYEDIVFDGYDPISIARLSDYAYERTLVVNGISKTYSMTGWRIGYTCGDKDVIAAMIKLQSQSTSNPTSIAQMAALEALRGPQDSVEKMRVKFEERRNFIVEALNNIDGITCFKPKGAFYVFPNISAFFGREYEGEKITGSMKFAELLLEHALIAVVPGIAFGDDRFMRFSFATSLDNLKEGVKRLEEFVKKIK